MYSNKNVSTSQNFPGVSLLLTNSHYTGDKKSNQYFNECNLSAIAKQNQRKSVFSNIDFPLIPEFKEEQDEYSKSSKAELKSIMKSGKKSIQSNQSLGTNINKKLSSKFNRKSTFTFQNINHDLLTNKVSLLESLMTANRNSNKKLSIGAASSLYKAPLMNSLNKDSLMKESRDSSEETDNADMTSKHINKKLNKIIIVEDNETILKSHYNLVKNMLISKGVSYNFKIITAKDGIEALFYVYKDIRDNLDTVKLIISDEMMTYMNGSELFSFINSKLLEKSTREKIPFIIVSAFNNSSHFEKMQSLGVDFYNKPLSKGNVEYFYNKYLN